MTALRTGFIGLGDIGGPMGRHLAEKEFETTLWARRPATLEDYADLDVRIARSPAMLGRHCDFVGVCVFADDDVREVLTGDDGVLAGMEPGGVIAVHSTVRASTIAEIAQAAAKRGIGILDAPISGARKGALAGALTIMVGGEAADLEKAMPALSAYGRIIEHVGAHGAGQAMKLLANMLGFANLRLAHAAMETGERLGLDPQAMGTILRNSASQSFNLEILIDRLYPDPAFCSHAVTMNIKDNALFDELRSQTGLASGPLDQMARQAIDVVQSLADRAAR